MTTAVEMQSEYRNLPLFSASPSHPANPRRSFDETSLNELADSIRSQGVLFTASDLATKATAMKSSPERGAIVRRNSPDWIPCPCASSEITDFPGTGSQHHRKLAAQPKCTLWIKADRATLLSCTLITAWSRSQPR